MKKNKTILFLFFLYYFVASVGYHFATYHSYPTYYTPFSGYSPISSFGLGLALGSTLGHHDHYYHDHYRPTTTHHHYYHQYDNNNGNNGGGNGGGSSSSGGGSNVNNFNNNNNAANGNNPNSNINNSGPNGNFNSVNANNLNNNPNQNMQANQNGTFQQSAFEQSPMVYSISGQSKSDDADSTEIVFTNPYLMVGIENMLLYGEFQDGQHIFIVIEQDSDGLEPYAWNQWNPIVDTNSTSLNNETTTSIATGQPTTAANDSHDTKLETIKIDMESTPTIQSTDTNSTTSVPLAPLP